MTFRPLISSNSTPQNYGQINDMVRTLNKEQQVKVFKGLNNTNAIITGKLPNSLGYGMMLSDSLGVPRIISYIDSSNNPILKVSKSSVNVTTATNDQLIFNSSQNVFKIVDIVTRVTASYDITGTASQWRSFNVSSPDVYTHNLGYIPMVIAFIETTAGQRVLMPYTFSSTPTTSQFVTTTVSVSATDTYLYFTDLTRVYGDYTGTGGNNNVTCYLLQETAN